MNSKVITNIFKNLPAILFKFSLTVCSLLLTLLVFLVKEHMLIEPLHKRFSDLPNATSYIIYAFVVIFLTWLSLKMIPRLSGDVIKENVITSVEPANDAFLPSYLGYFFVALSVPDIKVFFVVFGIISIFVFYSRISYFNPIFFLEGYNFYYVDKNGKSKVIIITRKKIKKTKNLSFGHLKRINDYTFIDMEA